MNNVLVTQETIDAIGDEGDAVIPAAASDECLRYGRVVSKAHGVRWAIRVPLRLTGHSSWCEVIPLRSVREGDIWIVSYHRTRGPVSLLDAPTDAMCGVTIPDGPPPAWSQRPELIEEMDDPAPPMDIPRGWWLDQFDESEGGTSQEDKPWKR